ncbi:MAG TPA: ABC transporter ATP-binding protein [Candidatus Omnitrophota bacterium]|nr:ABC transporter ATP-binding protein [Candidatus Omnitrophota bacterium]
MLEAKNISKVYFDGAKELTVLKEVSFKIDKGEFLSIVGPSGAGKSTLLHILGGLDDPSAGAVYLDNICFSSLQDREKSSIRNKRFGFVFQFYHLLREFSALENVILPALLNKSAFGSEAEIRKKALDLLDFLGLAQRLTHKPSELSGGEQQRVAIARALINEPEVLFCDEPTGNLDSESGSQIREMLFKLNKEKNTTLVVVTHSRDLAQGSKRIMNILDGKIASVESFKQEGKC